MIKVLIVEDHPMFSDGLRLAIELEDDITVVGQAESGDRALDFFRQFRPDVIILDINLPEMNGLQVLRLLKAERPQIAVIVLTAYHDSEQVLMVMRAGASSYCTKDIRPERLIEIIRECAQGYYVVNDKRMDSQSVHEWVNLSVEAYSGPYALDPNEHFVPLSHREMEILEFVTRGLSNKEIASRLQISQQTVKNHMTSILKKLNVQDRTQAAVYAIKHGWVRIQDGRGDTSRV